MTPALLIPIYYYIESMFRENTYKYLRLGEKILSGDLNILKI